MKDFRIHDFLLYLDETFGGYGIHSRAFALLENICDHAMNLYNSDPERFIALFIELIPEEITEEEISQFIIKGESK